VSCASPGYRYAGGMSLGNPTLVDARAETKVSNALPRLLEPGELVYPTWAELQHVCGTIWVDAFIDQHGRPTGVHVQKRRFNTDVVADENTAKHYTIAQIFDQPAINYVLSSKYAPAIVNGAPKGMSVAVPIRFGDGPNEKCSKP
ncbi:MAG TPA: hypothetical protein VFK08_02240, partial [Rhodanobacteraceae bacterium]|nr:hypothetical protein [Rhodanobacteraceae bacterium]